MKLIVGLGNPGAEYKGTRHNAGFAVVDLLASHLEATWKNDAKRFAQVATATVNGDTMILIKPETFMNESGRAVRATMSQRKNQTGGYAHHSRRHGFARGSFEIYCRGRSRRTQWRSRHSRKTRRGQRGASQDRDRKANRKDTPEKWVLGKPRGKEREELEITIEKACDAALDWMTLGIAKAMNKWN